MAYINKNDFHIVNYVSDRILKCDYFECDDLIAPAISLLNQKGYKTNFCCSGHPFPSIDTILTKEIPNDINILRIENTNEVNLIEYFGTDDIDPQEYPYCIVYINDYCDLLYVSFTERYQFPTLPDIFYVNYDNGCIYTKRNYNVPDALKSFDGIIKIYEINKIFYEWVKSLECI